MAVKAVLGADEIVEKRRVKRRRRRRFFGVILLLYVIAMVGCSIPDRLLLYPTTTTETVRGATRETITVAGETVEAWVSRSPGAAGREPEAFVIEFCGNASRAEWEAESLAARWRSLPVEVWTVNYPGLGAALETRRLKSIPPAALAMYDTVRTKAQTRPIFVNGMSIGTTAALYVASQRPVAGMVLQNAPPLQRLILRRYGWWNLWLLAGPVAAQIPGELNSLNTGPNVKAPAIFLMAVDDELVTPPYQKRVLDAYGGDKTVVETTGGHNGTLDRVTDDRFFAALAKLWGTTVGR